MTERFICSGTVPMNEPVVFKQNQRAYASDSDLATGLRCARQPGSSAPINPCAGASSHLLVAALLSNPATSQTALPQVSAQQYLNLMARLAEKL